ncbi:MAG: GspE/PulE family protein, partial [Candidatus Margulisiibacteriota bacterium]
EELDIRGSTMPTVHGEKAVLRLLKRDHAVLPLEDLGMERCCLDIFAKAVFRPQGLVLITGPTGSGKTTTLYAALNRINSADKNIVTIEDPVEYELPGINQTQVNNKAGLTFSKGLRSMLRQDPDVIMVGEIRDSETARIAVQAALTGHLVLSTLHTNSAAGAVERLYDMGVEPFLLASSLICVVAQRLVRLPCTPCRDCGFSGYRGRTGIYEILHIDEEIRGMITKGAGKKEIELNAGLKPLFEAGMEKVRQKITTEEELRRVVWEE